MPMGTEKNKTKQCPQKQERDTEDHTPPRLRTKERPVRFEQTSRFRAIQNYRPVDSICSGHFFLRLRLHVSASTRMLDPAKIRVCSVVNTDV
jgi:hypothetical protein